MAHSTETIGRTVYSVPSFRVRVIYGPDTGATQVSMTDSISIGKAKDNDLVLTDATVSRHHCVLQSRAEGIELRDLGSRNGTTIVGCRVSAAWIVPDAPIGVGGSQIVCEILDDEHALELTPDDDFGEMIGSSVAMRHLFARAERVANADAPVMIDGPPGSGKCALAEEIHRESERSDGPFEVIDCADVPPRMIEGELFGWDVERPIGALEAATGGTVVLRNIGALPASVQPKLYRILDKRRVRRVGRSESVPLNVRVMATTCRDLRQDVNDGRFRSELWHLLAVARLTVPGLRERQDDIPRLVARFYRDTIGDSKASPPADLVDALCARDWPDNVRALRHAVEQAALNETPAEWLRASAAPEPTAGADEFDPSLSFRDAKQRALAGWERRYLDQLMRRCSDNLSQAARMAKTDRSYLRGLLKRYGLR